MNLWKAPSFRIKKMSVEEGLNYFKNYCFSIAHLKRTEKHVSSPAAKIKLQAVEYVFTLDGA
jgi:hypothetical protein